MYSSCLERDLPLVITMGGGYSRPCDGTVKVVAIVQFVSVSLSFQLLSLQFYDFGSFYSRVF